MRSFLASFLLAALVAAIATPFVRRFALRLGAVSQGGGRNVHTDVIPRLGGVGIALAAALPVALLFIVDSDVARVVRNHAQLSVGLALGSVLMVVVGAIDDVRGVSAGPKLLLQVLSSCIAFAAGFRIDAISLPGIGVLEMGVFALPVTVIWIVGVTNAVNLIDGLDGLAAGVVFFAASTNFIIALIGNAIFLCVIFSAIMGALLGFLFHNFNPARIFMGDSGSYFLGFLLASTSLAGAMQKTSTTVALLVPVLALGVPIFDTLLSVIRRWFEQKPLFSPDRGHVHHRLLELGLTHKRAVLVLYGVSIVFAASAIVVAIGRSWQPGAAILISTLLVVGLTRFVGRFHFARFRSDAAAGDDELVRGLEAGFPEFVRSAIRSPEDTTMALQRLGESIGVVFFVGNDSDIDENRPKTRIEQEVIVELSDGRKLCAWGSSDWSYCAKTIIHLVGEVVAVNASD